MKQPSPSGFNDLEDYLWACGVWQHVPQAPYPRKGFIAETVFADEWMKLMCTATRYREAPNAMLADILNDLPRWPRAHDATICASVVCWLGTNCGRSVIHKAGELRKKGVHPHYSMLCAWAMDNHRHGAVNHGVRTIEAIMSKPSDWGGGMFSFGYRLLRRPRLSTDTYEVVEHLMAWLGDHEGWTFIERTENLITEQVRLDDITKRALWEQRVAGMKQGVSK